MDFIPQLLFIGCIFGYLVLLIFYKWIAFNTNSKSQPSLLLGLIGMFLKFAKPIEPENLVYANQVILNWYIKNFADFKFFWMFA